MKLALFFVHCFFWGFGLHVLAQEETRFEFSPQTAKPIAKALMKEDFFWSSIDDSGPFGSDAGSDAAYGFYHWRSTHPDDPPLTYLQQLINGWRFPPISWEETDTGKIRAYMSIGYHPSEAEIQQSIEILKKANSRPGVRQLTDSALRKVVLSSGTGMGLTYLNNIDEAIVGTAFAQIVMEGKIDPKLKRYAAIALRREMLLLITRQFGQPDQIKSHNDKSKKMLSVLNYFDR